MFEIFLAALVGYAIAVEMIVLCTSRLNVKALAFGLGYLLLVSSIAAANYELEIFSQKRASDFAFSVFKDLNPAVNSTFVLQAILNAPAYLMTDCWWAAIGTNVAIVSAVFYYVYDRSPQLSLLLFAPAIVNFSMFALRDPIIGVLFFMLMFPVLARPVNYLLGGVLTAAFVLIRPENFVIVAYSKLMMIVNQIRGRLILYLLLPIFLALGVGLIVVAQKSVGADGGGNVSNLPDSADEFYRNRADRNADAGSNILDGQLSSMPVFIRYPIQVITFFVLPLPFEIRGIGLALAFVDSIVFCLIYIQFHKKSSADAMIMFWIYVLAVSFFSSNYGNVFRIRMPAYFIMLGTLVQVYTSARPWDGPVESEPSA